MLKFSDLYTAPLAQIAQIAIDKTLEQGEPSFCGYNCKYYYLSRDGKELRCAMGHFFETKIKAKEANYLGSISEVMKLSDSKEHKIRAAFLNALQHAHDEAALYDFPNFIERFKKNACNLVRFGKLLDEGDEKALGLIWKLREIYLLTSVFPTINEFFEENC